MSSMRAEEFPCSADDAICCSKVLVVGGRTMECCGDGLVSSRRGHMVEGTAAAAAARGSWLAAEAFVVMVVVDA